jgi:DNA-binding NtrC family response regulator
MPVTPKVLVVEDDDTLRRVMHAQLTKDGYETASASDAPAALRVLEHSRQHLVIADLNLPGMSGVELLKRIQSDYPGTIVILMTAFGTVQSAVEAMKAGACDYIVKPIYPSDLRALVIRTLARQKLFQEPRAVEF